MSSDDAQMSLDDDNEHNELGKRGAQDTAFDFLGRHHAHSALVEEYQNRNQITVKLRESNTLS